jgi:hypothetical protein
MVSSQRCVHALLGVVLRLLGEGDAALGEEALADGRLAGQLRAEAAGERG